MCKFCDEDMSFGNESIYKDESIDVYIARRLMRLFKKYEVWIQDKEAIIKIKYCPMCGRKLD